MFVFHAHLFATNVTYDTGSDILSLASVLPSYLLVNSDLQKNDSNINKINQTNLNTPLQQDGWSGPQTKLGAEKAVRIKCAMPVVSRTPCRQFLCFCIPPDMQVA